MGGKSFLRAGVACLLLIAAGCSSSESEGEESAISAVGTTDPASLADVESQTSVSETTTTEATATTTTEAAATTTTTTPPPTGFEVSLDDFEDDATWALQELALGLTLTPRIEDSAIDAIVSGPTASEWVAVGDASGRSSDVRYVALYSSDFSTPTRLIAALGSQLYGLDSAALEAFNESILPEVGAVSNEVTRLTAQGFYDLLIVVDFGDSGDAQGLLYLLVPEGGAQPDGVDSLMDAARAWEVSATPSIGLGVRLVPGEVQPGRYRTLVQPDGFCLVRRLASPLGGDDDVIEQLSWQDGEQALLDIAPTDAAFENDSDCGRWELLPVDAPPEALRPDDPFPTGTLIVGIDVQPGTYRMTVPPGGFCLVQRLSGFGGSSDEVIEQEAFDEGESGFIQIAAEDVGFYNDTDCGSWQPA